MARPTLLLKVRDIIGKKFLSGFRTPVVSQVRFNSFDAACLKEYGKPLIIDRFKSVPLKPDEVRVDVQYCSLNIHDVKYLENPDEYDKTLPFVPGYELSGEVLEVGPDSDVRVGQRVVGILHKGQGGLAAEAVLKAQHVWEIHSEIPYPDAAALICGHSTALLAFTEYAPINEGDTILVIAGAGGYGLAAVEVANTIFKAKVIAVSDSEGKASLLRDRGAFAAFRNDLKRNYKEIMKVTEEKGVKLIYDAVGGSILNTVVKCIKDPESGQVIGTYRLKKSHIEDDSDTEKKTTKNGAGEKSDTDEDEKTNSNKEKESKAKSVEGKPVVLIKEVIDKFKTVNIFNYQKENAENYHSLISQTLEYFEDELITAHVSRTFKLAEVNEAIDYIKGKMCTGKVLIKIKDH